MKLGRTLLGAALAWLCLGFCHRSAAQVYSQNIVGYINQVLYAGNNLIANQLDNGDDTLNTLFTNSTPEGATFTKWDAASVQFLPLSTYDVSSGWSINYDLNFGEGGLFDSPSTFTNLFVGSVSPSFVPPAAFTPPLVSGTGKQLLSCVVPIDASFFDVVGRDPANGDYVTTLNPLTQQETTTTFLNGAWDNGDPLLAVGQSAFFGLGDSPSPVPEPATCALLGAGMIALTSLRRKTQ